MANSVNIYVNFTLQIKFLKSTQMIRLKVAQGITSDLRYKKKVNVHQYESPLEIVIILSEKNNVSFKIYWYNFFFHQI